MAVLEKLPGFEVIDGMKGHIDYYLWMGIPVARSWPRSPGHDRAPTVQAQWPAWTWASQNWNSIDLETQEAFKRMAAGTNMTGRDIFMKSYISRAHIHSV